MPVWLAAVRLGFAEGSEGYMKGARQIMSAADRRAIEDQKDAKKTKGRRFGRGRPEKMPVRTTDPGTLFQGDAAR